MRAFQHVSVRTERGYLVRLVTPHERHLLGRKRIWMLLSSANISSSINFPYEMWNKLTQKLQVMWRWKRFDLLNWLFLVCTTWLNVSFSLWTDVKALNWKLLFDQENKKENWFCFKQMLWTLSQRFSDFWSLKLKRICCYLKNLHQNE